MDISDKTMLRDIRTRTESLAADIGKAKEKGYDIAFSIDTFTGKVSKFEVTTPAPVNLDSDEGRKH
jgi:hypothetical protein